MRKLLIFEMEGRKTINWAKCITFSKICSMRKINPSQRGALLMIATSAAISYLLNPASGQVALAGLMAFSASTLADWWLFSSLNGTWFRKCLGGLTLGSAIDSFLFPTLAFGEFLAEIVALQFLAKFLGGIMWAYILMPRQDRYTNPGD